MKTYIVLLFALMATPVLAQPPASDPSLESLNPQTQARERQRVFSPREKNYTVHHGRLTYDGTLVQAIKAPNHLEVFNPFDQDNFPAKENVVWRDETRGDARGWSILSIRF